MVKPVDAVASPDHLYLLQLPQGGGDSHVVGLPLVLQDSRLQAGVDLVADDECHELDEELRRGGFVGIDAHCSVAKIGLVAPEELLRVIAALVQRERLPCRHLLGCHDAEVAAQFKFALDDLGLLPGEEELLPVVMQVVVALPVIADVILLPLMLPEELRHFLHPDFNLLPLGMFPSRAVVDVEIPLPCILCVQLRLDRDPVCLVFPDVAGAAALEGAPP